MCSGAVYQAEAFNKAFMVKKFLIKEATIHPIEVILHVFIHTYMHMCHQHDGTKAYDKAQTSCVYSVVVIKYLILAVIRISCVQWCVMGTSGVK